ncbi:MAG: nitrate reductase cytochrome c-type subunit [Geminicoccaceae bacterium]
MALASGAAMAQHLYGLRGPTPLDEEPQPPPLAREINNDQRQARSWPEQPPVIPHTIQGYQITLNANKCLTCHGRQFTAQSQAPMISITHFMDRDLQTLASVSPRRYFCTQCHVSQHDVEPVIENQFVDIDTLLDRQRVQRAQ